MPGLCDAVQFMVHGRDACLQDLVNCARAWPAQPSHDVDQSDRQPRSTSTRMMNFSKLLRPVVVLAALLLMAEEWLWERLSRVVGWISRLIGLERIEAHIARLPPYGALALFLLPALLILPVKLAGFFLLAQGKLAASCSVFLAAKMLGTAIVARIFKLTKPQLLQLPWLARLYERVMGWLVSAHAWFDSLAAVMATRAFVRRNMAGRT
jgi:hypothetical protein